MTDQHKLLTDLENLPHGQNLTTDALSVMGATGQENLEAGLQILAERFDHIGHQVLTKGILFTAATRGDLIAPPVGMGAPEDGTPEWTSQEDQVYRMLLRGQAKTEEEQDPILRMYVEKDDFSRSAINAGLERWKRELKAGQ